MFETNFVYNDLLKLICELFLFDEVRTREG